MPGPASESSYYAIVRAYGDVMAQAPTPPASVFRREAELPFPKVVIRLALAQALLAAQDEKTRDHLEVGYLWLEYFLPDEEFEPFERFDDIGHRILAEHPTGEALSQMIGKMSLEQNESSYSKIIERMEKRREELRVLRNLITGVSRT